MTVATSQLSLLALKQDAKIRACLAGERPMHFWYANCPLKGEVTERYMQLHQLGYDNYPVAQIPAIDILQPSIFFFERVLGADITVVDGRVGDFFHTWCPPLLCDPEAVYRLPVNLDASPLWGQFEDAIRAYLHETSANDMLPVLFPGLSPLDMACNLYGTEDFFLLLYEAPEAADHLLGVLTDLLLEAYQRIAGMGARLISYYGFPGVYCSDLQMPYLSPSLLARFLLPRYARIASACGGLCLALLSDDLEILTSVLAMDGVIGCAFDKRLPLATIREHLGTKVFFIPNYIYDDALETPTCRNGIWCNPIVQSYSRELTTVYQELSKSCNLAIAIERPSLSDVCAVREELLRGEK